MNKVLLTGANGFIGKYFLSMLLERKIPVRCLIRQATTMKATDIVLGDLTEPSSLQGICAEISTVYHLAGFAHAHAADDVAFSTKHMQVNFHGTVNLFHEAVKAGVKHFIYFSSIKAGDDTPYGQAKGKAEQFLLKNAPLHQMHITILRPSLVYGPHWKGNLASMMRAIDKGLFIPIPETHNRRSMVSVDDLCQAAMLCAASSQANGKIYYVSDGVDYSTRQLYEAMCQALGKKVPRWTVPLFVFQWLAKAGDVLSRMVRRRFPFNSDTLDKLFGSAKVDAQQIQHELAFKPRYDLYALLPAIVSVYKDK